MNQPTLFTPPKADGALTDRQQYVYDLLHAEPVGLTATQIGHKLHLHFGCSWCGSQPCRFAVDSAKSILGSLRSQRGLVVRRRSGLWQLIGLVAPTPTDPRTTDIPF